MPRIKLNGTVNSAIVSAVEAYFASRYRAINLIAEVRDIERYEDQALAAAVARDYRLERQCMLLANQCRSRITREGTIKEFLSSLKYQLFQLTAQPELDTTGLLNSIIAYVIKLEVAMPRVDGITGNSGDLNLTGVPLSEFDFVLHVDTLKAHLDRVLQEAPATQASS